MLDWNIIYWIHVIEWAFGIIGLIGVIIFYSVKGLIIWTRKQKEIRGLKLKQQEMEEKEALTAEDKEST